MIPESKLTCLNRPGYKKFFQLTSTEQCVHVARLYKSDLYCRQSDQSVVLPSVNIYDSFQNNPLPYKDESFDAIISHHALNDGIIFLCSFVFFNSEYIFFIFSISRIYSFLHSIFYIFLIKNGLESFKQSKPGS